MREPPRRRPSRALRLVLLAVLALAAALLMPAAAQAAPAPSAPSPAVLAGHRCQLFGSSGAVTYRGVQCIDFDKVATSMRAIGNTGCHTLSTNEPRPCVGIVETVTIETGSRSMQATTTCGSFGGAACPSTGRMLLSGPSPHIFCSPTVVLYKATVRSTTVRDNVTQRSEDFFTLWNTSC